MALPRPTTPLHDRPAPRRWVQIDPMLLIVTLLLIGYGLVMTYSTTAETRTFTGDPMQFVLRGALWAAVGMVAMVAVAACRNLRRGSWRWSPQLSCRTPGRRGSCCR